MKVTLMIDASDDSWLVQYMLKVIAGKPLLGHTIERLHRCQLIDSIALLLSTETESILGNYVIQLGVSTYCGKPNDKLSLFSAAAKATQTDIIVKGNLQHPLVDPVEVDRAIDYYHTRKPNFCSNAASVYGSGGLEGLGVEVFSAKDIINLDNQEQRTFYRENLSLNFFNYQRQWPTHPSRFLISGIDCLPTLKNSGLSLAMPCMQKFQFISEIVEALYPENNQFSTEDILNWYQSNYLPNQKALPKKKSYCFDIDGTICTNTEGDYESAQLLPNVADEINSLYAKGHTIYLQTARGATTGIDWTELTQAQMRKWGICYHQLFMAKPTADIYIDDKGLNAFEWHAQLAKKEELV